MLLSLFFLDEAPIKTFFASGLRLRNLLKLSLRAGFGLSICLENLYSSSVGFGQCGRGEVIYDVFMFHWKIDIVFNRRGIYIVIENKRGTSDVYINIFFVFRFDVGLFRLQVSLFCRIFRPSPRDSASFFALKFIAGFCLTFLQEELP